MYNDASRNPVSAMQCVDALLGPIQVGLAAFAPIPRYHYAATVSEGAYNRLASRYDELLEVAERNMLALRLKNAEQEIEILKLRAQLAKTQGRG